MARNYTRVRKQTREELESENRSLRAYQELVFCLFKIVDAAEIAGTGAPVSIESGEHEFYLFGVDRAAGGVIVTPDNSVLGYAVDVCTRWNASGDPYLRDCASQVHRAQKETIQQRYAHNLARASGESK